MANRRVRIVRYVKLNEEWTTLSLKKAQKLKIPPAEGRWYVTWREGRRILFSDQSSSARLQVTVPLGPRSSQPHH
jgi:hypothetical protein